MALEMNWLQKIAKEIAITHIPFQVNAALINLTEHEGWEVKHRTQIFSRPPEANPAFQASMYGSQVIDQVVSGSRIVVDFSVILYYEFPSGMKSYDSAIGKLGLELQAAVYPIWKFENKGTAFGKDQREWSPQMDTPYEVAQWIKDYIDRIYLGFGRGPDGGDDDEPDLFPEWPYSETEEETEGELVPVRVRNPPIRSYLG